MGRAVNPRLWPSAVCFLAVGFWWISMSHTDPAWHRLGGAGLTTLAAIWLANVIDRRNQLRERRAASRANHPSNQNNRRATP